jgi:WS/DGAT/MGAT family acyltransferase
MAREVRFERRMSDGDALLWNIETDPLLRSTILCLWLLDGPPDRARFEDKIERASRAIPRLRQRVVPDPLSLAPPRWERDPHFDLAFHVRWLRAPGDGSQRALLDALQPVAMQDFDHARPLWELSVTLGLEGGRAALALKLHHALSDGVGLVRMTEQLVERSREGTVSDEPWPELPDEEPLGPGERVRDALGHVLRRNLGRARALGRAAGQLASSPLATLRDARENLGSIRRGLAAAGERMSPLLRGHSLSVRFDTLEVPLSALKGAAKRAGCTLNDAYVAAVAGGLRLYHEAHGEPVDELRMTMPINMRDEETEGVAGNKFAPARFAVPVGTTDPVERMQEIHARVKRERAEPALDAIESVAEVLNRLPTPLSVALFGGMLKGIDFVTSNVPGPRREVFLSGARVEKIFGWGPLSGAALNATLFSYAGTLYVALASDPAAVPDPELLVECFVKGVGEVVGSVSSP